MALAVLLGACQSSTSPATELAQAPTSGSTGSAGDQTQIPLRTLPMVAPDPAVGSTFDDPWPSDTPLEVGDWLISFHRPARGLDAYYIFRRWAPRAYLDGAHSPNVGAELDIQARDSSVGLEIPEMLVGYLTSDGDYVSTMLSRAPASVQPYTELPTRLVEWRHAALPDHAEPRLAVVCLYLDGESAIRDVVVRYVELWPGITDFPAIEGPLPEKNALGLVAEQPADLGATVITEHFAVTVKGIASESEVRAILAGIEMVPEPTFSTSVVIDLDVRSLTSEPQVALIDVGMTDFIDSDPDTISHEVLLGLDGKQRQHTGLLPGQSVTLRLLLFGPTSRPTILVWRDTLTQGLPGNDQRYLSLTPQ